MEINMATITVEIEDSKAALLIKKSERFGLSLEQFISASIEDLISQPDPQLEDAMRRVISKNKELFKRLAK